MNKPTLLKIARVGLLTSAISLGSAGAASAAGLSNPTSNRVLSGATLTDCMNAPTSAQCTTDTLGDINAARASEGVRPMVLPANFASLSGPLQLMVIANLERADRGLRVLVTGLAADLNRNAQSAATNDEDPTASPWNGDSMSSNWAGGYDTTLEADFSWMYDDGQSSPNVDCTTTNSSGCWGHRQDILMDFDGPLMMGAAIATGRYGTSMTELFVGGDTAAGSGQADAPAGTTWAQITGQPAAQVGGSTAGSGSVSNSGPATTAPSTAPNGSNPTSKPESVRPVAHPASLTVPTDSQGAGSQKAPCTVPHLRGLSVTRALHALVRAHCGIGEVISMRASMSSVRRGVRHHRHPVRRLRVFRQSVRAGTRHHAGFRVALRVR